jgi:hypothetical protein
MRKILCALSFAAVAGIAPALAQEEWGGTTPFTPSPWVPRRSFEETLKFVLFGDSTKSDSIHKAVDETTTKLLLTRVDEKACSAGMIIHQEKPNYGETKTALTLDFRDVYKWSRSGSVFILEGRLKTSVLKSIKIEWLRIDTDEAKDEKARSDVLSLLSFAHSFPLPSAGDEQRADEAMIYLMYTLCESQEIIRFGPSTKF